MTRQDDHRADRNGEGHTASSTRRSGAGMYGSAGRIGVIDISSCVALSAELPLAVTRDVVVFRACIRLPGQEVSVAALDAMLQTRELETAAEQLADTDVDVITFACTSGSFIHGPGWDEQLIARITAATGIPASTTTTALVAALRELDVQRLVVGTPYPDEVNASERRFLEGIGIEVAQIEGLGLERDRQIGALTREDVVALALRVGATPSDAVFLSCTSLPTLPLLHELEQRLERPVISSNAVTIWDALRRIDAPSASTELGTLLSALRS